MIDLHKTILAALVEAGGEISCADLKKLYSQRGDGLRHATLIRNGLTEWVRPAYGHSAIAVRITDTGRAALTKGRGA